jgi:hypothetical protein
MLDTDQERRLTRPSIQVDKVSHLTLPENASVFT